MRKLKNLGNANDGPNGISWIISNSNDNVLDPADTLDLENSDHKKTQISSVKEEPEPGSGREQGSVAAAAPGRKSGGATGKARGAARADR